MENRFKINPQIGKVRNSVSFYRGKKHKDGSDFWEIAIFSRKTDLRKFISQLKKQGYKS